MRLRTTAGRLRPDSFARCFANDCEGCGVNGFVLL
jgi:hypothetical protein